MAGREKRRRVDPKADAILHIKNKTDKLDSLEALYINAEKGRGVFAKRPFNQGDFILEYRGDLFSDTEAQRRREVYTPTQRVFMFDLAGKSLCIDGAKEDGSLGRLVNDDHKNPNSRMRLVEVDKKSRICLFAIQPISIGEEISYDYGGNDWPWRKKPAEGPPRTSPDSAFVDTAAVPMERPTESALNTPPATVGGVSSCPEPRDKKSVDKKAAEQTQTKRKTSGQHQQRPIKKKQKIKPAEVPPRTQRDSAVLDMVAVPPTESALNTPPATLGGVSSCSEPRDKKSVDKKAAEQTQTKQKTSGQHWQRPIKKQDESAVDCSSDELESDGTVDQLGDESEWDSSSVDMGDDYIPPKGECEDSTDDLNGTEEFFNDKIDLISKQKAKEKRTTKKGHTVSSESRCRAPASWKTRSSIPTTSKSPPGTEDGDTPLSPPSVSVHAVSKKSDGKRIYNKKQFCQYCETSVNKYARHVERRDSTVAEVAKALSYKKGSKERKSHLNFLRSSGNFQHNASVLKSGQGSLIAKKRPRTHSSEKEYVHCTYCLGLFARKLLWKHLRKCDQRPSEEGAQKTFSKTRVLAACSIEQPSPSGTPEMFNDLTKNMRQDDVTDIVKTDPAIRGFGCHLMNKVMGSSTDTVGNKKTVTQQLRSLGRMIKAARDITTMKTIQDLVSPENFKETIKVARHVVGFDETTSKSETPSLNGKLGTGLNNMAKYLRAEALQNLGHAEAERYLAFSTIYDSHWGVYMSGHGRRDLREAKFNAPKLLPFTDDVRLLHAHLDKEITQGIKELKEVVSAANWKRLCEAVLANVILFNRRREGEVSKMELKFFQSRKKSVPIKEVKQHLTANEMSMFSHFTRIELPGKLSQGVPLLLTPQTEEALELLCNNRKECAVKKTNIYLFAHPEKHTYLRGSDCIRKYSNECGAKNPEALRSTELRKQIATLSSVLNLKDADRDQLARYLGHNNRIHENFYRLKLDTLQIAKVSKLLLAMQQGRIGDYIGMNLDEIDISPDESVPTLTPDEEEVQGEDEMREYEDNEITGGEDSEIRGGEDSETEGMSETRPSDTLPPKIPAQMEVSSSGISSSVKGRRPTVKKPWTKEETSAVERSMSKKFIEKFVVPGKNDCIACINANLEALKERDWRAVKFHVKNKITALKRKAFSH
ncbi:uncharacterized protein LOC126393210 isoform X3 [Epinephelus moara]|uniref:uncharacterized protein LOC126393210 isoform X3 n=1 Tax=Epinephelus moara TaxID=300413 RepID=UPI00214E0DA4|nr:uncharacterized protein LOC126393210 isoform X3 [Epinephelus moara]